MLYLGIDQHSKQITVSVRNQSGQVILRRQVSTRPEKIQTFFDQLQEQDCDFMAILEVCGFNDWLIACLQERGCREIVLIQPEKTSKKKTDRRDANQLGEWLWLNRDRLAEGSRPAGLRRVYIPTPREAADREITAMRKRLAQQRTRTLNKIQRILHRHNLMWDYPTKTFQTEKGRRWLVALELPAAERLEMDLLLAQWKLWEEQLTRVDQEIVERALVKPEGEIVSDAERLCYIPGLSHYGALALTSRIGPIERFPGPRSLSNFFGLTPGCRNSGNKTHRLGAITKQGSGMARFILGQAVIHVLKKDRLMRSWYRRIKGRRGTKIARVAVMRRLATIIWHMLTYQEAYYVGGPPRLRRPDDSLPDNSLPDNDPRSGSTKGTQKTPRVSLS